MVKPPAILLFTDGSAEGACAPGGSTEELTGLGTGESGRCSDEVVRDYAFFKFGKIKYVDTLTKKK